MLPWIAIGGGAALAWAASSAVVVGALPAGDVAAAETEFKGGDATALARAQEVRADWYDNGLAPGLLVAGTVGLVLGAGLAGVGVALMGGGE